MAILTEFLGHVAMKGLVDLHKSSAIHQNLLVAPDDIQDYDEGSLMEKKILNCLQCIPHSKIMWSMSQHSLGQYLQGSCTRSFSFCDDQCTLFEISLSLPLIMSLPFSSTTPADQRLAPYLQWMPLWWPSWCIIPRDDKILIWDNWLGLGEQYWDNAKSFKLKF